MADVPSRTDREPGHRPTRRDVVALTGSAVGSGLLAGCSGYVPTGDSGGGGYTAEIAPVGEITLEEVPEDVFSILTHHVDMAVALGHGDAINAMHGPAYYQTIWRKFTHHLDGVTVDWEGLYSSWPPTKEKLYELDSDLHLADPAKVHSAERWDRSDVEEIAENVGPWFGNTFSDTHQAPPADWRDEYEYYTLWEIFGHVADVFQERERYEALAEIHRSMLATIEAKLPPAEERPSAAMVLFSTSGDDMWGYKLNHPGYYAAHTRPLGATDALANAVGTGYGDDGGNVTLSRELLVEADPEVLLVIGPLAGSYSIDEIRQQLADHEATGQLQAVQSGRLYSQGTRNQGPLANLFQLEMTAKQLYPEQFGAWPGYEVGEPYPEIPEEEQLFDRDRVAAIVRGEFEA